MQKDYFLQYKAGELTEEEKINFEYILRLQKAGINLTLTEWLEQRSEWQEMWIFVKNTLRLYDMLLTAVSVGNKIEADKLLKYINAKCVEEIIGGLMLCPTFG